MGTATDPYQHCEGRYRLTRGVVEALADFRNSLSILTKSTMISAPPIHAARSGGKK